MRCKAVCLEEEEWRICEMFCKHKKWCPRSDQRCNCQRRWPSKNCPRNWKRFAKRNSFDQDYLGQDPVMIITSQWELGVWIPKGWVHNSECGDLPIFQVGFKFQAYSEQCSESNDNAFVYVNKANKSTPRQHEDNNPYLIFVLFLHRHKFWQFFLCQIR